MTIQSINPSTGELLRSYETMDPAAVNQVLGAVDRAQQDWTLRPLTHRARCLRAAARLLRERADRYAAMMAAEMGKPLAGGRSVAEKCAWVCDYYADNAERFLGYLHETEKIVR